MICQIAANTQIVANIRKLMRKASKNILLTKPKQRINKNEMWIYKDLWIYLDMCIYLYGYTEKQKKQKKQTNKKEKNEMSQNEKMW